MTSPASSPIAPRVRTIQVSPELLKIELERELAPCSMGCVFCPRTARGDARDLPPPSDAEQAEVFALVRAALAESRPTSIYLHADDAFAFPELHALVDLLLQDGRRLHIATPGLALADRAVAERFVAKNLRFDLTVHGVTDPVFTAMTGRPDARGLVTAAIGNLRALGIDHQLGMVVTDTNAAELGATLRYLWAHNPGERLRLMLFHPDTENAPPAYYRQHAPLSLVLDQLRALAADPPPGHHIVEITNLPPCQLDEDLIGPLDLILTDDHNTYPAEGFALCEACPASATCARLPEGYLEAHPFEPPDLDRVRRVLTKLAALRAPSARAAEGAPSGGPPPNQRVPRGQGRLPGSPAPLGDALPLTVPIWQQPPLTCVIEAPVEGRTYAFRGEGAAARFEGGGAATPSGEEAVRAFVGACHAHAGSVDASVLKDLARRARGPLPGRPRPD